MCVYVYIYTVYIQYVMMLGNLLCYDLQEKGKIEKWYMGNACFVGPFILYQEKIGTLLENADMQNEVLP